MKKNIFSTKEKAVETRRCFDCGCEVKIEGKEIKNGVLLQYEDNGEEIFAMKCNNCYEKNEGVADYKECEVYSRIVGYLRPVKNYNPGKRQEYEERKEYIAKV
ncbi:MAG: anaerobic ribonucleoside-triphosphate reductase [Candidatus Pacebacteria bacterium]|nr:anaerobic ribonucleoside-triphosphate reductase [Candidatus Paceibacterota bacterium]